MLHMELESPAQVNKVLLTIIREEVEKTFMFQKTSLTSLFFYSHGRRGVISMPLLEVVVDDPRSDFRFSTQLLIFCSAQSKPKI